MVTNYLEGQLRRDVPGSWTDNRLLQSQHNDGVTYVAINALMTAIRSSTVQINRKRKPIAFDSEGVSRVVKSLPTPGSKGDSKKHVPFDDEKNPLVRLINRPNPTETINEILAQLVQQIMLTGSGLLWMNVDSLTLPRELYVLPTALCQAQPPSPAYPYGYWRVTSYYPAGAFGLLPYPGAGGGVPIDARNIMRFKQPHPLWRWDALSPLTAGAVQLTILEAIDQARQSAMESGLTSDMFITAMGQSQEQMNAWMEILKQNNMGKRNHRKTVALGGESSEKGDVKVQFPNSSIKDMDFSQGWDQMSGFCLSLFGVPKAVANFTDASSYAQLFAALKQFHTLTLVPLAQWLSQWLTRHLCQDCFGEEFSIQIDVPAIDDADMAEKKRGTNLSNGLLMYNEARAQEGLSPVEGGDDLIASVFVQVQTAKAMAAAQPQPAPAAPGQPAPAPGDPNAAPPAPGEQPAPAEGEQQPDSTAAPGESLPTDPLSSLTGEGREPGSESLPDETGTGDAGDETTSTQDAVTNAALSALGVTSDKGDGASGSDDSPIPQNRIAKAYLANGNGHHLKAAVPVTKPGSGAVKLPAEHQEGQKFQGPSGKWFVIKNKRAVPTSAPGASESLPSPTSRNGQGTAAPTQPVAPAPDLDSQAKSFLGGKPSMKLLATGSGKTRVHEITDGASLKAYYADGGKLPTPVLESAAKAVPASTPAAQKVFATVDEWVEHHTEKHMRKVAAHFGVSTEKAYFILRAAIQQVADHAAKTGKQVGIAIKHNGKTVGIGPKKPAPDASTPTASEPVAPSHPGVKKLTDAVNSSPGLSEQQKQTYHAAIARVTATMPTAAHDLIAKHLKTAVFHPDAKAVGPAAINAVLASAPNASESEKKRFRDNAKGLLDGSETAGGMYNAQSGRLDADGHFDAGKNTGRHGSPGVSQPHQIYAHELGHTLDGPKRQFSTSPAWKEAFGSEIGHDLKNQSEAPLSRYGGTDPVEGFAEFSRLVYGSDVPHAQIAKDFPKATAYYKSQGLWPDKDRAGNAGAMPEVFDKKVPLAPDGSHADTLLKTPPKTAPTKAAPSTSSKPTASPVTAPSQPPKPTPTPARNPSGAPSIPKPDNPSGKGSLPPRPESQSAPAPAPAPKRGLVGRAADHALKFLGTPAEQRLAKRRIASRSITKAIDGVSYGCVMLPMPADITAACLEHIARIDDRDMIEPEGEPHVTLLYGLTDPDPQPVADILESHPPVPLAFGAFSLFTSAEHDVLKVDVESLPLRRLHGQLASLPHESSYPDYRPHLTIAYLKPGTGAYYAALFDTFPIPHGTATEAVYSDADEEQTTIPFAGGTVTKAAMSAYSDATGGALIAPAAQTPLVPSVRGKKRKRRPLAAVCKAVLDELDGDASAPVPELPPDLASVLASLTEPALPLPSE